MLSKGQLDGETYKTIDFKSTSCTEKSITGDFTLHGVTKSITMPAKMQWTMKRQSFFCQWFFSDKTTEYGFEPYSGMGGAVKSGWDDDSRPYKG